MAQDVYFGEYVKFTAIDGKGIDFMGADNLVGDRYNIDIRDESAGYTAYLVNRFGKDVGTLEKRIVRPVQLAQAKGWETCAYLSFVAFTEGTDEEHPSYYWGQVAVLMYDPKIAAQMDAFTATLATKMADGGRPQVEFGQQSIDNLVNKPGWFPTDKASKPKMGKGSSIVKDHRTPNERLIEQSRKGNIGCYVLSWVFIIGVIALVVFLLHSCGLF